MVILIASLPNLEALCYAFIRAMKGCFFSAKVVGIGLLGLLLCCPACTTIAPQEENHPPLPSANKNQPLKMEIIGQSGTDMIIINFVIPVMLAYYDYSGKTTIKNSAWDILKDIKPEKNKIINIFAQHANIIISNAFHTQGLLELYSRLCNNYLCNKCPIMTTILKN